MKYAVYEYSCWFGVPDRLIGIYDSRETAENVAQPFVVKMNRYIKEICDEEAPEK